MEIVINIPDKAFKDLQFFKDESLSRPEIAVKYGTPLPKGHGDLIDRNNLLGYTDSNICAYTPTINRYDIITTPTIIEADGG